MWQSCVLIVVCNLLMLHWYSLGMRLAMFPDTLFVIAGWTIKALSGTFISLCIHAQQGKFESWYQKVFLSIIIIIISLPCSVSPSSPYYIWGETWLWLRNRPHGASFCSMGRSLLNFCSLIAKLFQCTLFDKSSVKKPVVLQHYWFLYTIDLWVPSDACRILALGSSLILLAM